MTASTLPDQGPLVSVIVACYNSARFLRPAIESVLQQTYRNLELILVDDCSTDDSSAVIAQLQSRWPGRLSVLRHARNSGLSAARNTLMDAAKGRYLWFLDSDDKLLPGAIDSLRTIVHRHAPDAVLCDFQVWRERPRLKHRLRGEAHRRTFDGSPRAFR